MGINPATGVVSETDDMLQGAGFSAIEIRVYN
jgi:hypothetical protein